MKTETEYRKYNLNGEDLIIGGSIQAIEAVELAFYLKGKGQPSPSHAAQDRGEGKTELLFQGFRLDGTVAFTGLSIDGIAASYSPEKIKEMKLFEWTGVLDWHGQHIYRGNKVTSYNGKTGKEFTGIVEYEPQGCMYIIKGESRYLELSASAAQGDENGIKLTDVQIIGRAKI